MYYDGEFYCSATLINNKFLLSSADCFKFMEKEHENFTVILGDLDRDNIDGKEFKFEFE